MKYLTHKSNTTVLPVLHDWYEQKPTSAFEGLENTFFYNNTTKKKTILKTHESKKKKT